MIEQVVVTTACECLVKGSKEEAVALAKQVIDGGGDPVELMNLAFIQSM